MKIITLWQPWATFIALNFKAIRDPIMGHSLPGQTGDSCGQATYRYRWAIHSQSSQ